MMAVLIGAAVAGLWLLTWALCAAAADADRRSLDMNAADAIWSSGSPESETCSRCHEPAEYVDSTPDTLPHWLSAGCSAPPVSLAPPLYHEERL